MTEKKIQAIMIVEVAGRPAEYVKQGLEIHISKLDQFQDITLISKNISEPKKLENQQEAYVCFAEIEFQVPTFQRLLDVVFDFMPSSIEIVEPGKIEMDSQEATMFVNNLAGRLHRYDELAKVAQFKIRQLSEELNKEKAVVVKNKKEPEKKKTNKKKSKS
jgi:hypothetical protein